MTDALDDDPLDDEPAVSVKPREKQSWRERKAANAAKRAAAESAVAITRRVEPPPLPASDDPDDPEWVAIYTGIRGYDPRRMAAGYHFEPEAARDAIQWIESNVSHLEGPKAGENFVLAPYQRSVIANLFGWLEDGTDFWRYRECLIYLPKKAGKSALTRAIVLYIFCAHDTRSAKVYCAAAKRDQARIIWDDCKLELSRIDPGEAIASRFQYSIVKPDGGFLKPISADVKKEDGFNPFAFVCDELHRQPDASLINTARLSSKTRAEYLHVFLTTADTIRDSVCNDMWKRAKKVRDNPGDPLLSGYEPRFLPVIYEAEQTDDWSKPEVWRRANPSLGITIPEAEYAAECKLAQENPAMREDFLRYCLNLRRTSASKMFDIAAWDRCLEPCDPATLGAEECVVGIDLSSTTDITAVVALFPRLWRVLAWFWVPEDAVRERDKANDVKYRRFAESGHLTLTSGNQLDDERVLADMVRVLKPFRVGKVGIDPWNAVRYDPKLQALGYEVSHVRQGSYSANEPLKFLGMLVGNGGDATKQHLRHDGNPVLRWMAENAESEEDAKGNRALVKRKGADKIDGIAALSNAIDVAIRLPAEPDGAGASFTAVDLGSDGADGDASGDDSAPDFA